MGPFSWAALGVILTFSVFLSTVIFRMGQMHSRLEALEKWRWTMRDDMHEISDILTNIKAELNKLAVLIEERTERRNFPRIMKEGQ